MSRRYQRPRKRVTAAILALFMGSFGVQKIYLRQTGIAIFMVFALIATRGMAMPFFALFGFIDAFRLLTMSDHDFDRKYNRYASRNRRDDYLENRRQRQLERSNRGRLPQQRPVGNRQRRSAVAVQKANPFKASGIKKYKDFDLEGAIEDFQRGLDINKNDVALHFNIACAYSLTEEKDKAYHHLSRAVELGFKDFQMIDTKDDLAFVRIQPEYDSFKASGFRKIGGSTPRPKAQPSTNSSQEDAITDDVLLSQLNKLAELRKKGLLSEQEFDLERKKLLRR